MTGPPPELFANSLTGAGYSPCKTRLVSLFGADLIPILGAATPSLNSVARGLLSENARELDRKFDYMALGGCVPGTKIIADWWPLLARDEYTSV